MKKRNVSKLIGALALGLVCINSSEVAYAECVIDGQYAEWNENDMDSIESLFLSKVDVVIENGYVCFYAKENGVNPWENYFSYLEPIITTEDGKTYSLAIYSGEQTGAGQQLSVVDRSGNVYIDGCEAIRTKDDTYRFEMRIPCSYFGNVKNVSLKTNYTDRVDFVPTVKDESSDDETSKETTLPEETTQEGNSQESTTEESTTAPKEEDTTIENITSADSGIIIDGLFEDWESYPHIYDTNWNMPEEQRTKDNCRTLGLYNDGEYLYIHITMIHGWPDPFNSNYFNIIAAGEQVDVYLYTEDGMEVQNVNFADGTYDFILHYHHGTPGMADATPIDGAEACFVRKSGQPDEIEVKIPLEIFTIVHGIDVEDIKEISVKNPSIFDQGMTIAGSSSAPYIGIAICVASVLGGIFVYNKKKSKLNRES